MKTFEERYTAWVDGALRDEEKAAFEREHPELLNECDEVRALQGLLREQFRAPELSHPDFFNSELLRRIEREQAVASRSKGKRSWLALPRWALAGFGSALVAIAMVLTLAPHGKSSRDDYVAQVLKAHTDAPGVKATVDAKKDVTIIRLDGLEKLPPDKDLK